MLQMNLDHDTPDGDNHVNDNNDDNNDHDNNDGNHDNDNNDYDNNKNDDKDKDDNGDDNNHVRYYRQHSLENFLLMKNLKFFHLLIHMYVPVLMFCCSVFACYFEDLMFSGCDIISL